MKTRKIMFSTLKKVTALVIWTRIYRFPLVVETYVFLYRHFRPSGITLINVEGHKMYVDPEDMSLSAKLLMGGVYERQKTELFKKMVKEGMVVVDLGANIGYYTLMAARLVGESGRVFAFEPEPNNYALLVKNIEANGYSNVIPMRKAVSNKNGEIKLFLAPEARDTSRIYDSQNGRESMVIKATCLDEFFKDYDGNIDFIKIDIEGAEMLALEGMTETIRRNKKLVIITECHAEGLSMCGSSPEAYLGKLMEYNFKLYQMKEPLTPIDIATAVRRCGHSAINLLCLRETG